MANMFKHYPQPDDYIPNNYPRPLPCQRIEIMAGETSIHSFDIPFNIEETCDTVEVIYTLGVDPVIVKVSNEIGPYNCGCSTVTCRLSPDETLLFKNTTLNARVQLKFHLKDGNIIYSEIYKVFAEDSLDASISNND